MSDNVCQKRKESATCGYNISNSKEVLKNHVLGVGLSTRKVVRLTREFELKARNDPHRLLETMVHTARLAQNENYYGLCRCSAVGPGPGPLWGLGPGPKNVKIIR